jgi:hypothetical protein
MKPRLKKNSGYPWPRGLLGRSCLGAFSADCELVHGTEAFERGGWE